MCNDERSLFQIRNEAVLLSETQDAVVAFAHSADLTADGPPRGLARNEATGLRVNVDEVELDGRLVLRVDDAVGRGALARHLNNIVLWLFEILSAC